MFIYAITHSRRQQVRIKLHLHFICFAVILLLNPLNHVRSFNVKIIRLDQKHVGLASLAIPTLFLVSPDKIDINMVFSICLDVVDVEIQYKQFSDLHCTWSVEPGLFDTVCIERNLRSCFSKLAESLSRKSTSGFLCNRTR